MTCPLRFEMIVSQIQANDGLFKHKSKIVVECLSVHLIPAKRVTDVQNTYTADVIVVEDQRGQCLEKEHRHH